MLPQIHNKPMLEPVVLNLSELYNGPYKSKAPAHEYVHRVLNMMGFLRACDNEYRTMWNNHVINEILSRACGSIIATPADVYRACLCIHGTILRSRPPVQRTAPWLKDLAILFCDFVNHMMACYTA